MNQSLDPTTNKIFVQKKNKEEQTRGPELLGPEGWGPKPRKMEPCRVGPRRGGAAKGGAPKGGLRRVEAQNLGVFFSLSRHHFALFVSLLESSRGILVVFEAPGP